MASVGPLLAPGWVNQARMSSRRRCRVRPSWASPSRPAGTPAESFDVPGHGGLAEGLVGIAVGGE